MDSKDFEDIYYKCQKNPNLPDVKLGKFSAKNYRSFGVKDTAHSVKSDNPDILKKWIAIKRIADHIINQNVLTPKDTIIPAPQHTGRAEYTLEIAKIISEKTGCKIADVLGCVPRDTLYNLKKKNGSGSITDSGIYLLNNKFPKYNVWFLDNVIATGTTFNDVRKLIPHIKPLIYSISPRLKVKMKNRKPYFIREGISKKRLTLKEGLFGTSHPTLKEFFNIENFHCSSEIKFCIFDGDKRNPDATLVVYGYEIIEGEEEVQPYLNQVIDYISFDPFNRRVDICLMTQIKESKMRVSEGLFNPKPSFGLVNEIAKEIEKRGYDADVFKKGIYDSIKESKDMKDKIKALVSKIEE